MPYTFDNFMTTIFAGVLLFKNAPLADLTCHSSVHGIRQKWQFGKFI